MPAGPADYTPAQRIIAAATRLRKAWSQADLDVTEMHEAALGLMWTTGTRDLAAALGVLPDVEAR